MAMARSSVRESLGIMVTEHSALAEVELQTVSSSMTIASFRGRLCLCLCTSLRCQSILPFSSLYEPWLRLRRPVGSPHSKPSERKDDMAIPEVALRPSMENENFHTGRGGEGNVHVAAQPTQKHPEGLADKLKNKLFKKKAAKETPSS